ncbi:4262_t:CDS:2 [Entrophospora sp. SA101]|nr:4262_t:CDS:2 [Entrophospora sp. SA101]
MALETSNNDRWYQNNIALRKLCIDNSNYIFDVRGSSLRELILAAKENPLEIWKLHYYNSNKNQYVLIFVDGSFKKSSKLLKFHTSMIAKGWFKDLIDDVKLKKENILSSNCIRTYNEPKLFVEAFDETSVKFRKDVKIVEEDKEKYLLVEKVLKGVY